MTYLPGFSFAKAALLFHTAVAVDATAVQDGFYLCLEIKRERLVLNTKKVTSTTHEAVNSSIFACAKKLSYGEKQLYVGQ